MLGSYPRLEFQVSGVDNNIYTVELEPNFRFEECVQYRWDKYTLICDSEKK